MHMFSLYFQNTFVSIGVLLVRKIDQAFLLLISMMLESESETESSSYSIYDDDDDGNCKRQG